MPNVPQPLSPQPSIPELQLPQPLPVPEELLPAPNPVLIPDEDTLPGSETITVQRFRFTGNTAFSQAELGKVTEPFVGRPISFAELLQARSAITDFYVQNGYITSGALIPPQTFQDGAVTIQVVEGEVAEINVTTTGRLNPNYVRQRLALATAQPLNYNRLLEALQLLQLNPLIETISAELSTGVNPGESILNVRFETADTFRLGLFADNTRPPSVGTFRRGIEIAESNLFGQGDGLHLTYSNTDGSNTVDALYLFPINARNGAIEFYVNYTDSQVVEPPFEDLEIEANSRTYEIRYRQPIFQTPTEELALGIVLARRESDTAIAGVNAPLSRGADAEGKTRLSIVRLSQDYVNRTAAQVFAVRSQFSFGVGLLDATLNGNQPDSEYFAWRGQAQWLRALAPDTLLLVRSDIQLSTEELVPLEQIGLGGFETVRGYRQDLLLRDNALFASAELRYPILKTSDNKSILHLTPFVDFGQAWSNDSDFELEPRTLLSMGLGLRWQYTDQLIIRADWGIPLLEVDDRDRTLQEQGLYFSVEWWPL
ncbi:MAG: ShlB/FhaC/HecB family hemolysin secretion/activation protein [Microcoleaceae cyanobacterium]